MQMGRSLFTVYERGYWIPETMRFSVIPFLFPVCSAPALQRIRRVRTVAIAMPYTTVRLIRLLSSRRRNFSDYRSLMEGQCRVRPLVVRLLDDVTPKP